MIEDKDIVTLPRDKGAENAASISPNRVPPDPEAGSERRVVVPTYSIPANPGEIVLLGRSKRAL